MRRPVKLLLFALLLVSQDGKKHYDPSVHEATRKFKYDDFRVVPVRVHLLRSSTEDSLNCRLQEKDVRRVFEKVNRIWHMAGVAMAVESIVDEAAVVPSGYRGTKTPLDDYNNVRPRGSRGPGVVHVYYVHRMRVNGVHLGLSRTVFAKDTANLTEVRGGVDEPLPRVTAHEIGHHMGLGHRQDRINLMASGTTGWSVNDTEIATVRRWAEQQDWVLAPKEALDRGYRDTVAAIPGAPVSRASGGDGSRAWLGILAEPGDEGLVVSRVFAMGATARGLGLRKKDILLSVNGAEVSSAEDLRACVSRLSVGDEIVVSVRRRSRTLERKGRVRAEPSSVRRWPEKKRSQWY
jgi:hypothetical protein